MDYDDLCGLSIKDLWERLNETQHMEKADTALALSRRLMDQRSYAESVAVSEQAAELGAQLKDSRVQAEALQRVGTCCYYLEQYPESVDAYLRAVPFWLSESDEAGAANAIRHAIDGLMQLENFAEVIRIAQEGQAYAEIANDDHLLAELLSARGHALSLAEQYMEALSVFEAARTVWKRHQQVIRVIDCDAMLSKCHSALGDEETALSLIKNAYELAVASEQKKMMVIQGICLGRIYDMAEQLPPAEEVLNAVLPIAARHEDFSALGSIKAWLANNYRQTERIDLALETGKASMMLFESINETDEFDYVVAAAVVHPIAVEREDHEWVVRSADALLAYGAANDWPREGANEAAFAYVTKLESLAALGRGEELIESLTDQSAYLGGQGLDGHVERTRRMLLCRAEAALFSQDWLEAIHLVMQHMPEMHSMEFQLADARAYEILATAQEALELPAAAEHLAMAHALYFRFSRYDKALELQDLAISSGMARLRSRRLKEIVESDDYDPTL